MKTTSIKSDDQLKSNKSVIGTFEGKCGDIESNNNSMILDTELWKNLFDSDEYKMYIQNRQYIGFLGHPEDPGCQDFEHACIVMTDGWIDDDGQVYGKFDLVDTPVGRIVKSFIDAGVNFGISIRGAGDISPDGYVDPTTFVFRGFDLVSFPAYDDAIPKFTEIAASSDPKDAQKYASVVKTVTDNLSKITSTTTLDNIKSQFNEKSPLYASISQRESELSEKTQDDGDVNSQKVEAMTQLYLSAIEENKKLKNQIATKDKQISAAKKQCSRLRRVMSSTQRMMSEQLSTITASNKELEEKYRTSISANSKLKSNLDDEKQTNLKYRQKVNANKADLRSKDEVIASLRSKLRKTVMEKENLKKKPSNFDEQISRLRDQVTATESLVEEYQDAYAKLYSTAIGVGLHEISVTASTTVDELKSLINSGTSTANIPAKPDMSVVDIVDEDYDSDIVSM